MSDYLAELRRPILADREQYLVVCYSTPDDWRVFRGWVRLSKDGLTVSARKPHGRRWFRLCKTEHVVSSRMLDWAQR